MHESVRVDGPSGQLARNWSTTRIATWSDHLDRINAYSTLAARQMHESGRRANALLLCSIRLLRFFGTTSCDEGSSTARSA